MRSRCGKTAKFRTSERSETGLAKTFEATAKQSEKQVFAKGISRQRNSVQVSEAKLG